MTKFETRLNNIQYSSFTYTNTFKVRRSFKEYIVILAEKMLISAILVGT